MENPDFFFVPRWAFAVVFGCRVSMSQYQHAAVQNRCIYWIVSFTYFIYRPENYINTCLGATMHHRAHPSSPAISLALARQMKMTGNDLWVKSLPVSRHTMTMSARRFVENPKRSMEPHFIFFPSKTAPIFCFVCQKSFQLNYSRPMSQHSYVIKAHYSFTRIRIA